MVDLSLPPLYVFFMTCLVFTDSVIALRKPTDLDTKYMSELCQSDEMQKVFLLNTGTKSALKIKPNDNITADYDNCTLAIYSSAGGVILKLISPISYHPHEECSEYIQVQDSKNSSKLCGFKNSFVSGGVVIFSYHRKYNDSPRRKVTILATSYSEGDGICSPNEFKCDTGECIWKNFKCDGIVNCPDASDEFSSGNSKCIAMPHLTLKPIDFDWNIVFPTTKSILEYRKSFNVTISAAVACAFLIFIFGVLRLVCHYHFAPRNSQPGRRTNLRSFSIIRQRPDFQPQFECPPPPSYVSLISDSSNIAGENPPPYSTVTSAEEENSLTEANKDFGNNALSGPPPPYEP